MNLGVTPGLDYFYLATSILRGEQASNSLLYIYIYLLAGLYYNLLVRPVESYSHVEVASNRL